MLGKTIYSNDAALKCLKEMCLRGRMPQVITISGGTCSGKTVFAQKLQESCEKIAVSSVIIPLDSYFRDGDDVEFSTQKSRLIFDVPQAYHQDEFLRDILNLAKGIPVSIPVYDIASNKRKGGTEIIPRDFIIAEGLFAASFLNNSGLEVVHVYMDTPLEECLNRRIRRDTAAYHVSAPRVVEKFKEKVWPFWYLHQQSEKTLAHIIVNDHQERISNGY